MSTGGSDAGAGATSAGTGSETGSGAGTGTLPGRYSGAGAANVPIDHTRYDVTRQYFIPPRRFTVIGWYIATPLSVPMPSTGRNTSTFASSPSTHTRDTMYRGRCSVAGVKGTAPCPISFTAYRYTSALMLEKRLIATRAGSPPVPEIAAAASASDAGIGTSEAVGGSWLPGGYFFTAQVSASVMIWYIGGELGFVN